MIEYLEWDSHFFNKRIGRCIISSLQKADFISIIEQKENSQLDIVYLFVQKINRDAEKELIRHQAYPVDNRVYYVKKNFCSDEDVSSQIELYSDSPSAELLELAYLSGHQSRFKKDSRLNESFKELYKQWIIKSISGEMADAVFVAKNQHSIEGFVTIQKNGFNGQIGLIGVLPEAQGKGLGSKLIKKTEIWCLQNGIDTCTVITQMENTGACKLYEKNGYSITQVETIYHI